MGDAASAAASAAPMDTDAPSDGAANAAAMGHQDGGAGAGADGEVEQKRKELQGALEEFVERLRELEVVLEDQPDQLHTRMYVHVFLLLCLCRTRLACKGFDLCS